MKVNDVRRNFRIGVHDARIAVDDVIIYWFIAGNLKVNAGH
jgi:hypothetical protein